MSDAYGMMILSQSENLVCDFDQLVDSLNGYRWNASCTEWVEHECFDGKKVVLMDCHGYGQVQYPSVFPEKFMGIVLKDEHGTETFIKNPTKEEFDDHWDVVYDTVSLEELVLDISKHLKVGQITVSSISNEKHLYVQFEHLVITSEGTAKRSQTRVGSGYNDEFSEEIILERKEK